jgi:GNAT superfamily N-acetyltransferase
MKPDLSRSIDLRGEQLTLRPLEAGDVEAFGTFLEGLSAETDRMFHPHPFTRETARELCANLKPEAVLRMVVLNPAGEIAVYFIITFEPRDQERDHYENYGVTLGQTDCMVGLGVADSYQNSGLASATMPALIDVFKVLGMHRVILAGGVFEENGRAVHFYEKVGFKKMGEFIKRDRNNFDMMLTL